MHVFEVVSVGHEPHLEKLQTHLEKLVVVTAFEDRVVDIADEVLEKGPDHSVYNLANLQIDVLCKSCCSVVLLKLHAASDVLFGGLKVQFVQCESRVLHRVDCLSEVKTDVVH